MLLLNVINCILILIQLTKPGDTFNKYVTNMIRIWPTVPTVSKKHSNNEGDKSQRTCGLNGCFNTINTV